MISRLSPRARRLERWFRPHLESLEARLVLDLQGLPILHSLPGAPTAVYLDFNGGSYGGTTYAPYDEDGNPNVLNATEQQHITNAWQQVSQYFAMFDTDVTTEHPTVPFAWDLISNSVSGGYSYVGVFPNTTPRSFNQSSDARTRTSGLAHEIGHNFGLQHQSDYDLLGNKTNEYTSGYDNLHGAIMGVDYARTVHKWFLGHPSNSATGLQDDLSVIASKIRRYEPPGGDGYRPNDYGGTIDQATPLADYGDYQYAEGVVERQDDRDAFSFTTDGNPVAVYAYRAVPSPVHLKLEIYQEDGTILVAAADPNNTDQYVNLTLPAGTYYAIVSSFGEYGDVGAYSLFVAAGYDVTPPDYNGLPSPTGLTLGLGTGTGIDLSWDAVDGATGYAVERSADGAFWSQVATTTPDVTSYSDANLTGWHRYFYRVSALDDSGLGSVPSDVANLLTRPRAPFNVTVTSWRTDQLIINWRAVPGDAGYRVERSADGVNFSQVATVGRNINSYTDTRLTAATTYYYRITARNPLGDSLPSPVASGATRSSAAAPGSPGRDGHGDDAETGDTLDPIPDGDTLAAVGAALRAAQGDTGRGPAFQWDAVPPGREAVAIVAWLSLPADRTRMGGNAEGPSRRPLPTAALADPDADLFAPAVLAALAGDV